MHNSFYDYDLSGFTENEIKNLRTELLRLRLIEVHPELGGGAAEIPQQILAYITLHYDGIILGVVTNLISSQLVSISSAIYKWYKTTNPASKNSQTIKPVINIDLHLKDLSELKSISICVDKEYSEAKLKRIIELAETSHVVDDLFEEQ